jgi:predicted dehydrogenase
MIRAAIVGLGWWRKPIVRRMQGSRKLTFVAALEASEVHAGFAAEQGLRIAADWDDLLGDSSIDAVILCAPHAMRIHHVLAAAAAGKHVFCEKLPVPTSAELAVSARQATGVVLRIGHECRLEPAATELRRMISDGVLGAAVHAEASLSLDGLGSVPDCGWRAPSADAPAAGMTAMGTDLTDLYLALFGPVTEIYAQTAPRLSMRTQRGIASIQMRFESGATGYLGAVPGSPHYLRMAVFGTEAWVEVRNQSHSDMPGFTTLTYQHRNGYRDVIEFPWEDTVCRNLESFADAIERGTRDPVTDAQTIAERAAREAICASAAGNMPIRIESSSEVRLRPVAATA